MSKPGLLTLTIKDKSALYLAYMPFIKNGGLFIPTNSSYKLGDEVFMLLNVMGEEEKIPVAGRVIWITPKGRAGQAHRRHRRAIQRAGSGQHAEANRELSGRRARRRQADPHALTRPAQPCQARSVEPALQHVGLKPRSFRMNAPAELRRPVSQHTTYFTAGSSVLSFKRMKYSGTLIAPSL